MSVQARSQSAPTHGNTVPASLEASESAPESVESPPSNDPSLASKPLASCVSGDAASTSAWRASALESSWSSRSPASRSIPLSGCRMSHPIAKHPTSGLRNATASHMRRKATRFDTESMIPRRRSALVQRRPGRDGVTASRVGHSAVLPDDRDQDLRVGGLADELAGLGRVTRLAARGQHHDGQRRETMTLVKNPE